MNGSVGFEVLRFTGAPVSPDVALLELEGRFAERAPRGRAGTLLVVESAEETLELEPSAAGPLPEGRWWASYAVPLTLVGGAVYSLAVGRHLLLDLPAPEVTDVEGGPVTHHVRLAREANELRARLDDAEAVRNAAKAAAGEATATAAREHAAREKADAAREQTEAALAEAIKARLHAEEELAAAATTADERVAATRGELEAELAGAREEAERDLAGAREEAERDLAAAHEEAERREEEAIAAERARASVTSHELRSARAEIEALKRELGVRRAAGQRSSTRVNENGGSGEEITAKRTSPPAPAADEGTDPDATRRVEAVTVPVQGPVTEREAEEGVRVLSRRAPRPRHRLEDETEPSALMPGAAAIGARSFEPAGGAQPSGSTRALAFAALAVAMLAALLVIVARVGLF